MNTTRGAIQTNLKEFLCQFRMAPHSTTGQFPPQLFLVWFEPTDIHKATKVFKTDFWKTIAFASPNLNELRVMASATGCQVDAFKHLAPEREAWQLSQKLITLSPSLTLLITLGPCGVLVVRHASPDQPLFTTLGDDSSNKLSARLYPALCPPVGANLCESGAGDCLAAGVISRALDGCSEREAIGAGLAAALASLICPYAVPPELPGPCTTDPALYHTVS